MGFFKTLKSFLKKHKKYLITAAVVGGAILAPFVIVEVVAALGFTGAGIAAGSAAASMMSSYGGAVAAGSFVAILQSVGAAGLGIGGAIASAFVGGILGGASAKAFF